MKREIREAWVEALRSGDFRQGKSKLSCDGAYCCLGVLQTLYPEQLPTSPVGELLDTLPAKSFAGIGAIEQQNLANMNDDGASFSAIADYIETNL